MTVDLEQLLPAVYRLRDLDRGGPLAALLALISDQAGQLKDNVDDLLDDFFIETCADWIVPYIADLVANQPLPGAPGRRRADVARTVRYRRRKGTLPMLDGLARDVTGWPARTVAFFELLAWTQHLDHLRPAVGTAPLRALGPLDELGGAFDGLAHTADVRPLGLTDGRYGLKAVGFFLWPVGGYPLQEAEPRPVDGAPHLMHVHPLGIDSPLFAEPAPLGDDERARREHVPAGIRPVTFALRPEAVYGDPGTAAGSVLLWEGDAPVPLARVICRDLGDWHPPEAGKVALDVRRGRIAWPVGAAPDAPAVSASYGFSADVGGGPYPREEETVETGEPAWTRTVSRRGVADHETVRDALLAWTAAAPRDAVIRILDNATYSQPLRVDLTSGARLIIRSAAGRRPVLAPPGRVDLRAPADGRPAALFVLDGVLVDGGVRVRAGALSRLRITHCTLAPPSTRRAAPAVPGVEVESPADGLTVEIRSTLTGSLLIPAEATVLDIADSVIDGGAAADHGIAATPRGMRPGPPTRLERCTVLAPLHVVELRLVSNSILAAAAIADRRQAGCARFSFLASGSRAPRRYRCQPDLSAEAAPTDAEARRRRTELQPDFTSVHYGDPGYARLSPLCPDEIAAGADDGSEMGAFAALEQPQREANLRLRLDEYLPFGLQPGLLPAIPTREGR